MLVAPVPILNFSLRSLSMKSFGLSLGSLSISLELSIGIQCEDGQSSTVWEKKNYGKGTSRFSMAKLMVHSTVSKRKTSLGI